MIDLGVKNTICEMRGFYEQIQFQRQHIGTFRKNDANKYAGFFDKTEAMYQRRAQEFEQCGLRESMERMFDALKKDKVHRLIMSYADKK